MKGMAAVAALLALFLSGAALAATRDIPYLTGRVVDNAEILSPAAAAAKDAPRANALQGISG